MAYIGRQVATAILGNLKEFTDVASDAYVDGDFLIYDSGNSQWLTTSVSIGSLNDVNISGASNNNILAYNGSNFVPTASPTLTTVTATTFTDGTASMTGGAITGATTATFSSNVSVGGNLDVTGNITLGGNIDIGDAATDTVTITADIDSNLIPNADSTYTLGDSSNYWSHAYIDAITTTGNAIVGGTLNLTNNFDINSNFAVTAGSGNTTIGGTLSVTNNFDINSNFSVTAGSGNTTVGGTFDVTGATNINNTTSSTSATSGALIVDGGMGVAENLNVGGNVAVTGNLTISGTTTTVNSTTVTIDDPIFTLGGDTAPGSDDNKDRGIEFRYYDSAARVGFFGWDDSATAFTFLTGATNSSEVFSGTPGTLNTGHLIPSADNTYDLGETSSGNAWRHLFLKSNIEFTGGTGANKIQLGANQADALTIEDIAGTPNEFLTFQSTTGDVKLVAKQVTDFDSTINVTGLSSLDGGIDVNGSNFTVATTGNTLVGGTFDVSGASNFNSTVSSTSNTTGAVIIDGGLGLAENLNMGGNADIDGNLVVLGTTQLGNAQSDTITVHGKIVPGESNGHVIVTDTSASQPVFIVQNTADDATSPTLIICNERANPADNDVGGIFEFRSYNDQSAIQTIAKLTGTITDVTDGTEDGKLVLSTMKAGTVTDTLTLESGEVAIAGAMTAGASAFTVSATGATQINNSLTLESNNNFTFNNGSSTQVFQVVGSTGATTIAGPTVINNTVATNNNVTFTNSSSNNFNINNSSNVTVFDVDMSTGGTTISGPTIVNNTMNVNNGVTFKNSSSNNFNINNSSNTTVFDVDMSTGATIISGATSINNTFATNNNVTFTDSSSNNFNINNSSNNTVFDIDMSTGATIISGGTTINNTLAVSNNVTFTDSSTNNFKIENSSNTAVFNVAMSTGAVTIEGDTNINNTLTLVDNSSDSFTIQNSSNNNTFNVDMSTGATTIVGPTTINNTLAVNNNVTFTDNSSNNFTIKNTSNANTFNIDMSTGATTILGDTNINNTLTLVDASSDTFTIQNSSNNNTFNIDMSTGNTTIEGDVVFNDNRTQIKNSSNTTLFDIDIANTAVNIDLDLTVSNNVTFDNSITFNIDNSSNTNVFQVLGATGNTTIGGTLDVTGIANFNNTTQSTSTSTGALIVDGGVGIAKNLYVGGNLVVSGTTTQMDITTMNISDALIKVGDGNTGTSVDLGMVFTRGDGSSEDTNNVSFFWDESADEFALAETDTEDGTTNGNVTITRYADVHVGGFEAGRAATFGASLGVTGEATLASATVSDLTDNRIVIAGTAGSLEDDANLTFDGSILTVGTTAAIKIPVGTTGQRPTAAQGQIRFNTTDTTFEGYDGTAWGSLGGIKDVDGDTYISAEDAAGDDNDELDFYTAGTLRATIDSSGDLKFGASVNKLTVAGATGNTTIAGTLDVEGQATITNNLVVDDADKYIHHGDAGYYTRQYVLYGTTTDATETEIFVGGTTNSRVGVASNTTIFYEIKFVARRTDATGEGAGWHVKGVVDNHSGTTADVGDLYEIIVAQDDADWQVDAQADDTNDALKITCTGEAGKTIKWVAIVTTTEVLN